MCGMSISRSAPVVKRVPAVVRTLAAPLEQKSARRRTLPRLVGALVVPVLVPDVEHGAAQQREQPRLELQRAQQLTRGGVVRGGVQQQREGRPARGAVMRLLQNMAY